MGALDADPAGVTVRALLVDAAAAPSLASPSHSRSAKHLQTLTLGQSSRLCMSKYGYATEP